MSGTKIEQQMEVLLRGADHVYTPEELEKRVAAGKPLRVKLGLDPWIQPWPGNLMYVH